MPIQVNCNCGQTLQAKDEHAGMVVKCPGCQNQVQLPAAGSHSAPPPTAASGGAPPSGGVGHATRDDDNRYSIAEFVEKSRERDRGEGLFEMETDRLLEVNLNGDIMIKTGAMVAYVGNIKYTREGLLDHGVAKLLKKAVTGEGMRLTKAAGMGKMYLADAGKKIQILYLNNESLFVNGNDLLVLENGIKWDIKMMRKITAMVDGGLFNVKL